MAHEQRTVTRAEFGQNLHEKAKDRAFMGDIQPLLRPDIQYDAPAALDLVRAKIVSILPGDPWRGATT